MSNSVENKGFKLGFLSGILLIVLFNIFLPTERYNLNNLDVYGFPFAFYQAGYEEREGGEYLTTILWLGLSGNLIFTLLVSFLAGLSLRFLTDKELNLE